MNHPRASEVERLLKSVPPWAQSRPDIKAVALVGSWARGAPRDDSDLDLVVITTDASLYVASEDWASGLGITRFIKTAAWGALLERRGTTQSGLEVEFGITSPDWARVDPIDPGTLEVVNGAMREIYDPNQLLALLARRARNCRLPAFDLKPLDSFPEARRAVDRLVSEICGLLRGSVVGVYFDGSIALRDFDPARSDIDLVVVTEDGLTESIAAELTSIHATFAQTVRVWGEEVEVVYVTRRDLNARAVEDGNPHRFVERGSAGALQTRPLDLGWHVHLRVLWQNGIAILGPDIRELVTPVDDEILSRTAGMAAERRTRLYRDKPGMLERPGARAFAVLTACRMLYTFRTGKVVPKMEAARASVQILGPEFAPLIRTATDWRKDDNHFDQTPKDVIALLEFVRNECARG